VRAVVVITTSAYAVAKTYLGTDEVAGKESNAQIVGWLREVAPWASGDDIPWCGAFVSTIAKHLGLPTPKGVLALRARAWLAIGKPVQLSDARAEEDVVILKRGRGKQPGPEMIDWPGHVGFFAGHTPGEVHVLGGNQGDSVTLQRFPTGDILGIRRLA
jgi:uncharacterized protein (TIGR02594 family)